MANYFFDSVDGNDANNGSTWALAKKTLEGLSVATTGTHTLYFKSGVYCLLSDKTISPSVPSMNYVGVGPVVFKNPNRRILTISTVTANAAVSFYNITFNNVAGGEMLRLQSSTHNSIYFVNCAFRISPFILSPNNHNISYQTHIYFNNCAVLAPYTLLTTTEPTTLASLDTSHLLYNAPISYPSVINIYASALRKNIENGTLLLNGSIVGQPADVGEQGPTPYPFMSYNKTGAWVDLDATEMTLTTGLKFANWFDDASYLLGRSFIDTAVNEIVISLGTSARAMSPVYKCPLVTTLKRIHLRAFEIPGVTYEQGMIDSTHDTVSRTIEYRASATTFLPNVAEATLPWVTVERDLDIDVAGIQFIQFRVTLDALAA